MADLVSQGVEVIILSGTPNARESRFTEMSIQSGTPLAYESRFTEMSIQSGTPNARLSDLCRIIIIPSLATRPIIFTA